MLGVRARGSGRGLMLAPGRARLWLGRFGGSMSGAPNRRLPPSAPPGAAMVRGPRLARPAPGRECTSRRLAVARLGEWPNVVWLLRLFCLWGWRTGGARSQGYEKITL